MTAKRMIVLILVFLLILNPISAYASDMEDDGTTAFSESDSDISEDDVSTDNSSSEEAEYYETETEEIGENGYTEPEPYLPSAPSCMGISASGALIPTQSLSVDGEAVLLLELSTGTMLYAKNIDVQREPASVTKIMTCLLALEYGGLYDEITVTESALETMDPDGSSAELSPGDVYTLEELLYCLMVASANDAALVIAEYLGGSQEGFAEMMNARAAQLGCTGTHFANPHGLHAEAHYTTARDLAIIFLAALEYDLFWELISTEYYSLPYIATEEIEPESEDGEPELIETVKYRDLYTTDYLISTDINDEYYDSRVFGGKTGFTTPAGRCVVACAEEDGLSFLAVVLGATAWDENDEPYFGSFVTVSALLDTAEGWQETAVVTEESSITVPVLHGIGDALLYSDSSISALLPQDYDPSELILEPVLDQELVAPLEADVPVGILEAQFRGIYVGHTVLFTKDPVAERVFSPRLQWIRHGAMGVLRASIPGTSRPLAA